MKRLFSLPLWRAGATVALALGALLGGTAASAASPSGTLNNFTPANTTIGNKATLTYSVGGVSQNAIGSSAAGNTSGQGSTTTFVVDNLVSHLVVASDAAPVSGVPGQAITATFVVSNTGNNTQDYALTFADLASGSLTVYGNSVTDNFQITPASCTIYVNNVVQGSVVNLPPDYSEQIKVACLVPAGQVNGDLSAISVVAEAMHASASGGGALPAAGANTLAGMQTVRGDAAGTDDGLRDARHSTRGAFRVVTAALSVAKIVSTHCDTLNGNASPYAIPGAYMRYTVSITNNGSTTATLSTISDTLAATVNFDPDLIAGATAAACAPLPGGTASSGTAGNSFQVLQTNRPAGFPKYLTASSADADGASYDLPTKTISINFGTILPVQGSYTAGELKVGETVQLIYQVQIK